jgi:hypothetical protein
MLKAISNEDTHSSHVKMLIFPLPTCNLTFASHAGYEKMTGKKSTLEWWGKGRRDLQETIYS